MEARATALVERAINKHERWVFAAGRPPQDPADSRDWEVAVRVVAAYRDRYDITSAHPLGTSPESVTQRADRDRAADALRRAQHIAGDSANGRAMEVQSAALVR